MHIMTRRRRFIAIAYWLRVHPSSSVMGLSSGDVPKWSAECALTASTPTPRATQARHDSPNGADHCPSGGASAGGPLAVVAGIAAISA
jgi:hypothetical protein